MPEDFNMLRQFVRKLVKKDFQKEWLFRLEVDEEPKEFDLFVKDISYGPLEVTTEEDQYGSVTTSWPTVAASVKITATVREDEGGTIASFIDKWCEKVVHKDGTVGLPYGGDGYVRKVRIYYQKDNGAETLNGEWDMYPITRGDISMSRENGGFLEFPITFVQFSTSQG